MGELQAEDRDPAGALQHHGVARPRSRVLEQRPPGGQRRARQGRHLLVGQELRDLGHALLAEDRQLRPAPGIGEPSDDINFSSVGGPEIQSWKNIVATRSPGFTRVTPGPTASMTPQPSENGVIAPAVDGARVYMPLTISMSR